MGRKSTLIIAIIVGACFMAARSALPRDTNSAKQASTGFAQPGGVDDPYWLRAEREVYKSVEQLQTQHEQELAEGKAYRKLMRGSELRKVVALTFDDGPHPDYTLKLLAILKKYHVKATFFVVGKMAERYPTW